MPISSMKSKLHSLALKILPCAESCDLFYHYTMFILCHWRLPKSNSRLFNDHLFFLKVGDELKLKERGRISDKELVKEYVTEIVGKKFTVPTLGLIRTDSELAKFCFPQDCYIKATNGSGQSIKRRNNSELNYSILTDWLKLDYYLISRQRNYRGLTPKIIVEPILFNDDNITDYRFFCMNGRVKFINVERRGPANKLNVFLDPEWNEIRLSKSSGVVGEVPKKVSNLLELIKVAEDLSQPFSSIRVDLYTDERDIFVGELTNCHCGANRKFRPLSDEKLLSIYINL